MIDMIKRFPGIGCAYIGQNGDPGYEYYGFSDKESQREVDERTIFPACSISKFITAICTMKLSEQGIIDIDEAADKYLSSWKLHGRNGEESDASVRHLLQHTAGIFDGEEGFCGHRMTDRAISITEILEGSTAYNNRPAVAGQAPGTAFEYSDAGFCILRVIALYFVIKWAVKNGMMEAYKKIEEKKVGGEVKLSDLKELGKLMGEHPIIIVVTLAAMVIGAILGVAAYYQGWLG